MENKRELSYLMLRIALGLVFLYFGYQQAINPDAWASYVPQFLTGTAITANNLVIMNSLLELSLGTMMMLGLYTRFSSLVLSIHLLFIALSIGFNPVGMRDLGLTFATFAIFLNGPDKYTLDRKIEKVHSDK